MKRLNITTGVIAVNKIIITALTWINLELKTKEAAGENTANFPQSLRATRMLVLWYDP